MSLKAKGIRLDIKGNYMTKMIRYITIVIFGFMALSSPLFADNLSQNKAKAYFFVAEDAYISKNYTDALTALVQVQKLLGKSNDRISALKVKIYFAQNDFIKAERELNSFFSFKKINKSRAREMSLLLLKIDKALIAQKEQIKQDRIRAEIRRRAEAKQKERVRLAKIEKGRLAELKRQNDILAEIKRQVKLEQARLKHAAYLAKQERIQPLVWFKKFGGKENDIGERVINTADGGYVMFGKNASKNRVSFKWWLIKVDQNGSLLWQRFYGNNYKHSNQVGGMTLSGDGGIILVGNKINTKGKLVIWASKVDSSGHWLWDRTYKSKKFESATKVIKTHDGGYMIIGGATQTNKHAIHPLLIKIDKNGKQKWHREFKKERNVVVLSHVIQTKDHGFLVMGKEVDPGQTIDSGHSNLWYAKLDKKGRKQWAKFIDRSKTDATSGIYQTADGNIIIAGNTSADGRNQQAWVMKVTMSGEKIWETSFKDGKSRALLNMKVAQDGSLYFIGAAILSNKNVLDIWAVKINQAGKILWQRTYGGKKNDIVTDFAIKADGSLTATGYSKSFQAQGWDAFLVKFEPPKMAESAAKMIIKEIQ